MNKTPNPKTTQLISLLAIVFSLLAAMLAIAAIFAISIN